ncbi:T-cell leukemia/lymphoma protein 1A isoform X1 [Piliocolobus tephrosceles]|uniref:T-cell leukemia/lymphoma protein 1A isoform X1 n=1 Tax=Piliocolobus tephrosceles TaxID=591936 RepID=UPI000C298AFA|nr:T-cell leukemia/lymphoma protein 1A isoform X1 [Piliocolobus tephrosceles]
MHGLRKLMAWRTCFSSCCQMTDCGTVSQHLSPFAPGPEPGQPTARMFCFCSPSFTMPVSSPPPRWGLGGNGQRMSSPQGLLDLPVAHSAPLSTTAPAREDSIWQSCFQVPTLTCASAFLSWLMVFSLFPPLLSLTALLFRVAHSLSSVNL